MRLLLFWVVKDFVRILVLLLLFRLVGKIDCIVFVIEEMIFLFVFMFLLLKFLCYFILFVLIVGKIILGMLFLFKLVV